MTTQNIYDMADTWNNVATTFTAIKMDVLDTASAAASKFLDLLVGGVSKFSVDKSGSVLANALTASGAVLAAILSSSDFVQANRFLLRNTSSGNTRLLQADDGQIILANDVANGFDRLMFGGSSSSFPSLKRSSAVLQVRLADDSADAQLDVGALRVNQAPTANGSASTLITSGADSSTNLGHRASFNMNGTTYWFPCGSVAF